MKTWMLDPGRVIHAGLLAASLFCLKLNGGTSTSWENSCPAVAGKFCQEPRNTLSNALFAFNFLPVSNRF